VEAGEEVVAVAMLNKSQLTNSSILRAQLRAKSSVGKEEHHKRAIKIIVATNGTTNVTKRTLKSKQRYQEDPELGVKLKMMVASAKHIIEKLCIL